MVVKEHFVESYGAPALTIGEGGSGGAIQQYQIVQNYPGLLDAAAPMLPFPDAVSIAGGVLDCGLLTDYYGTAERRRGSARRAAAGRHRPPRRRHLRPVGADVRPQHRTRRRAARFDLLAARRREHDRRPPGGVRPARRRHLRRRDQPRRAALHAAGRQRHITRSRSRDRLRRPAAATTSACSTGSTAFNAGRSRRPVRRAQRRRSAASTSTASGPHGAVRGRPRTSIADAYETGTVNAGAGDLRRIPIISVNLWTDDQGDIHDRDPRVRRAGAGPARRRRLPPEPHALDAGPARGREPRRQPHRLGEPRRRGRRRARRVGDRRRGTEGADDAALSDEVLGRLEQTRPDDASTTASTARRRAGLGPRPLRTEPVRAPTPTRSARAPRTAAGAPLAHDILKCELRRVADAVEAGALRGRAHRRAGHSARGHLPRRRVRLDPARPGARRARCAMDVLRRRVTRT